MEKNVNTLNRLPKAALIYDFDKTLCPGDMQEYGYLPVVGMAPAAFWKECRDFALKHNADGILSYMYMMLAHARGKVEFTRDALLSLGKQIEFYQGVETWFDRINRIGLSIGVEVEHYIISSGLYEIIHGSPIGDKFKAIFAASFCYDDDGIPFWPATAVNYTSKTQYLFRINKGILDVTNDKDLNAYTPHYMRAVPFTNMIYIGDGLTDVPCMKMTKQRGGYSIAVHKADETDIADGMLLQNRADFSVLADYSEGSEIENVVSELFKSIVANDTLLKRREEHYKAAYRHKGSTMPPDVGLRSVIPPDESNEEI